MKICEVVLQELKTFDTSQYGGWISPDNKVHYVKPYKHEDFVFNHVLNNLTDEQRAALVKKFKLKDPSWIEPMQAARELGFVRFHTEDFESFGMFSVDGTPAALKATYKVWAPTAMQAREVYLDDKQYSFPRDKAKFIKMFT